MSSELPKPIEELLRASAEKRRAEFGRDPGMPNPMRARLHEEIRRSSRNAESLPRRGWLGLWWPRLTLASALIVILAGSILWWHAQQTTPEKMSPTLADRMPMASAPAVTESPALFADAAQGSSRIETQKAEKPVPEPKAATSVGGSFRADTVRPTLANALDFRQQQMPNESLKKQSRSEPAFPVLQNFQVEQTGRQIRVVDNDGSAYTGTIEHLAPKDTRNLAPQAQAAMAAAPAQADAKDQSDSQFYFRATGFNGTLQKSLVFEGNYLVSHPNIQDDLQGNRAKTAPQLNARIIGTAKIAGQPPQRIDAVNVAPH